MTSMYEVPIIRITRALFRSLVACSECRIAEGKPALHGFCSEACEQSALEAQAHG